MKVDVERVALADGRPSLRVRLAGELDAEGEASPLPGYSPDSIEAAASALEGAGEFPRCGSLAEVRAVIARLPAAVPSARFALETALLELLARTRGVPVHVLLSPRARAIPVGHLAADPEDAARAVARGIRTVKLKVLRGSTLAAEVARIGAVRAAIGPDVKLRLDANGQRGVPVAELLRAIAPFDPELIEEPGPPHALAALAAASVPVALDESLATAEGREMLPALAARGVVRAVVLKPMLLGGLLACVDLAEQARALGLEVIVTHMFDGPIAFRAAAHLAIATMSGRLACGLDLHAGVAREPPLDVWNGTHVVPPRRPRRPRAPRPLVIDAGTPYTGAELWRLATCEAGTGASSEGGRARVPRVQPVIGESTPAVIAECLLAMRRRVPIVLVHPRLLEHERRRVIEAATCARLDLEDPPLGIIPTSGTSGPARLALLGAEAFRASAEATIRHLGLGPEDRWLLALPLAHVGGFSILTRCLLARSAIVLPRRTPSFNPAVLIESITRDRVTITSLVPTMLHRLLRHTPRWTPPPHLRAILLGGAAAPAALLDEARERRLPVLTTYGLTEACSQVTLQPYGTAPGAAQGSGVALDGVELRVDTGEIEVRGPTLFRGYLGAPPHTGWLATGDLGELDGGRLFVRGRRSDLIVTGGENVHPAEVEDVLTRAPNVAAAGVAGVPDAEWGELVCAAVVPREDRGGTSEDVLAFAREQLAPHKRPRRVLVVPELPAKPGGKLDRAALRALLAR